MKHAGILGGVFAIIVLYFFLRRFDSTFIVSLCIPFSVIAACGLMYFMGKTLNILSMCGLMLGIGMLVDDAIVVLESIDRRRRTVSDANLAAQIGAREVSMAVTCSTLTPSPLPFASPRRARSTTSLRRVSSRPRGTSLS